MCCALDAVARLSFVACWRALLRCLGGCGWVAAIVVLVRGGGGVVVAWACVAFALCPPSCGSCGAAEIARGSGTGEAPYVRARRAAQCAARQAQSGNQREVDRERERERERACARQRPAAQRRGRASSAGAWSKNTSTRRATCEHVSFRVKLRAALQLRCRPATAPWWRRAAAGLYAISISCL